MRTINIGRAQDNDVVVNESCVSRHHCQLIQYDDGKVAICDNGSTNGIFVNGKRVVGKRILRMYDSVMLGQCAFPWTSYVPTNIDRGNRFESRTTFVQPNNNNSYHPRGNGYVNNVNNIQNNISDGLCDRDSYRQPEQMYSAPAVKLRTNRSALAYIFLSLITLGLYGLVVKSHISSEINYIASKHDGRNTVHYCLVVFLLSWLTLGIYPLVWHSNLCSRMGNELVRRGIPYCFGAGHFWGWNFLGSLIIIGPLVFLHKFFKAMNKLCADYNQRG